MTMRMYADRKSLPLERTTVTLKHSKIHAEDCAGCETKEAMLDRIERVIAIEGSLDAEQRKKLMEIANKCPVHRTLTSKNSYRDPRGGLTNLERSYHLLPRASFGGLVVRDRGLAALLTMRAQDLIPRAKARG